MRTIFFLSLFFIAFYAKAQSEGIVIKKATYALDSLSEWKRSDLISKKFNPFAPRQSINIGYNKNASVWCTVTLKNKDSLHPRKTWLCFNNNHLDSIVLYGKDSIRILGDRTNQVSPYLETQAFAIQLSPGEERTVLAKVKKGISFFEFSCQLGNEDQLASASKIKLALISFFLGILFLLLLFNSILFYISRNKMYIYYIFYSILSAIYVMVSSYYAKYLLFGDFLYFSELRVYSASFWLISLLGFLCHYIELKVFQPKKYKLIFELNRLNFLIVVFTLVCLLFKNYDFIKFSFIIGYLIFFVVIVLILWAAFVNIKNNKSASFYLLLAFLPHFIWGMAIILKTFETIPNYIHEDALIYICLYEVMLFGYVLTKNYIETFHKNNQLMHDILVEQENSLQAITLAQIRERRNIANIIHDKLGSKIAYILQLIALKKLTKANESIHDLAVDIRDISHKILPKSLDDGALVSSLKSQVETWNAVLTKTKIEIFAFDFPENLKKEWIFDIYLIAMEIITNALKHGKAKEIHLELYAHPEAYVFQFTDDGIGFDVGAADGFGLQNAKKRILFYGGEFEINSTLNQGTIIQISIPVTT